VTLRDFEKIAAALDAEAEDPMHALSVMAEIASGLFPGGLPGMDHVTWAEEGAAKADEAIHDPRADAEARLKAAEARFRTLVEQIPAVTFMAVLGQGKNEIYVSPHIEAMLGYSQEEWLKDPFLWYWRLHPEDRIVWNEEFARGCRTGGPFRADCRFLSRDERVVWVHGEARLVRDSLGRPMFLQGVAFDITEIKSAQATLLNDAVRRAKSEEELVIARRVQLSILPKVTQVAGLEISAAMVAAEDVGGDYYDVQPAPNGAWLAIGDVAGHGLNAGLVMLMVQAATAALTKARPGAMPRELMTQLNEILYDNIRARLETDAHITFTLFRFFEDGRLIFAGAHEDIILVRKDGSLETLRPPGAWLGARPDIKRVTVDAMLMLEPGDLFVLYTDGITEARNSKREMYDLSRLCDRILATRELPVDQIRDAILQEVAIWEPVQDDDRTVLVVRYGGPNG
jgi:PAS domain S-box-containing protein